MHLLELRSALAEAYEPVVGPPPLRRGGSELVDESTPEHTAAVIGRIVGTGIALAAFPGTSLGDRMTNMEGRMANIETELRATRTERTEERQ